MATQGQMIEGIPLINSPSQYQGIIDEIGLSNNFYIEQKLQWLEGLTQGCCEQQNKYRIYNEDGSKPLFGVMEQSEGCNRCFCAPNHTYSLHVVGSDAFEINEANPELLQREGCCGKWLCCWTMAESCQNNADVFPTVQGTKYTYEEKICNGCKPEIVMYVRDAPGMTAERVPIAIIQGPAFFGGCSEACVESQFTVSTIDAGTLDRPANDQPGNIATIMKRKPEDCGAMITECCTDVDKFNLNFNPNYVYNRDPNFKLAVMAALFYLDYMFFEMDNGMCYCADNTLYIVACNLYCCGCICPCEICISGNN